MNAYNKLFLDTNRHHLMVVKTGSIQGLFVPQMLKTMREEFKPDYPEVDNWDFDKIVKLIVDIYRYYDAHLGIKSEPIEGEYYKPEKTDIDEMVLITHIAQK